MKKIILAICLLSSLSIGQSYTVNISRYAAYAKSITFDMYLKNTNVIPLPFNGIQIGLIFNRNCTNSGTVTIVRDTTDIHAMFVNYPMTQVNTSTILIIQTYSVYTGSYNIVSGDSVLIGRYTLTNSVPFAFCRDSLLSWCFTTDDTNYTTGVIGRIGGYLEDITSYGTFSSTCAITYKGIPRPTNLFASCIDIKKIYLSWKDNSDYENDFVIQRKLGDSPGSDTYSTIATVTANQTSFIDSLGLQDATLYTYRIYASNNDTVSDFSNQAVVKTLLVASIDYSGKTYHTIGIGNQCWLRENLDVGTMIHGIDTAKNNGIVEKYCYNDSIANCDKYGGLYQWNEAMQYVTTEGTKGICPTSWHLPTWSEFQTLTTYINNDGNVLKAIGQGGTNTSGFTALMAGVNGGNYGFDGLGYMALFWSSTEGAIGWAMRLEMDFDYSFLDFSNNSQELGFSIRCLQDEYVLPVELISFSTSVQGDEVKLLWNTETETNNKGFEVQRRSSTYNFIKVAFVDGGGTSTMANKYSWSEKLQPGKYSYRLKQVDLNGEFKYSKAVEVTILPNVFSLRQNFPNPFNASSTINYSLAKEGNVKLTIYNAIGSKVATIVDEYKPAGNNSVQFNGSNLASGIYLYRLQSGNYSAAKKFIMMK